LTVYYDEDLSMRAMECPGPGVGTLYVVAEGFDRFLTGVQFAIDYPPSMTWLADLDTPPVTVGSTPTGISMGFALPENGFDPIQCMRVMVIWDCTDCSMENERWGVVAHPLFGGVWATDWPNFEMVEAVGRTSVVCDHAYLDIKPGSCPNPFNSKLFDWAEGEKPKKGGVLPVAILGSESFDVTEIDMSSILLEGVAPLTQGGGPKLVDVAGLPMDDSNCQCTEAGPDGQMDIQMKFRSQDIAAAIGHSHEPTRELTLTGVLHDGLPFEATDCIKIVGGSGMELPDMIEMTDLQPAVPNPFNPVTQITFSVAETQHVRLAVYDVSGRLVDVLENGVRTAGEHTIEWDAKGLSSGVYFYQLRAGNETLVKRMTLLK
jgi:hypothetical protein